MEFAIEHEGTLAAEVTDGSLRTIDFARKHGNPAV